ncbi:MAG: Maf family protein [Paracoccaceae bacterium]
MPTDPSPAPWPGERPVVLASASAARADMLRAAGLNFTVRPARIDEAAIRASLEAGGAAPRDVADALAGMKAARIANGAPSALVLGCDQILDLDGRALGKPATPAEAESQLRSLSGRTHRLWSAAVVFEDGRPVWRQVGRAELTLHPLSPAFIGRYVGRNWESIRGCVGGYRIEGEGIRLMAKVEGDWFTIIGLPLIELLTWLRARGDIAS